jgi:uncharacterized pyridoxamine 5'-phosphate oxidase family protein
MSKIGEFLKETGVFFLATEEGNQPRIRPLGAYLEIDGKIIFAVGDFKNVYNQLQVNPQVEIVACKQNGHWLRYTGTAVFETDEKYSEAMLDATPNLRNIYNEQTGHKLKAFHIENATAVDIAVMGEGENLL